MNINIEKYEVLKHFNTCNCHDSSNWSLALELVQHIEATRMFYTHISMDETYFKTSCLGDFILTIVMLVFILWLHSDGVRIYYNKVTLFSFIRVLLKIIGIYVLKTSNEYTKPLQFFK